MAHSDSWKRTRRGATYTRGASSVTAGPVKPLEAISATGPDSAGTAAAARHSAPKAPLPSTSVCSSSSGRGTRTTGASAPTRVLVRTVARAVPGNQKNS